jgi:hypothetical protein
MHRPSPDCHATDNRISQAIHDIWHRRSERSPVQLRRPFGAFEILFAYVLRHRNEKKAIVNDFASRNDLEGRQRAAQPR